MRHKVKIKATRGVWTADVAGERLGILHAIYWTPPNAYHDPARGGPDTAKRHADLVEALRRTDRAVVQRDRPEGATATRDGYVGVFRFEGLVIGDDGSITLKLVERVAEAA